jgi:hypothetical protein
MTQLEKLEKLVKEWEQKAEDLSKESSFARNHNFFIEAQMINQKRELIEEICRSIRLKVIEELISV